MSQIITYFRRLLFRRRGTTEKSSGDSQKCQKTRTKSLNLPAGQNSLRDKNRTEIHVKRGSQVTIRNRSQSVIVERKHVSRSGDKTSSPTSRRRQSHYTIHTHHVAKPGKNMTSLAPTLTSSYRSRAGSAPRAPTVIVIHS